MAIGKNKKLGKGRKGGKKKYVDPMSRKEWYDFKAPYPFDAANFGKTCINRTTGTSNFSPSLFTSGPITPKILLQTPYYSNII